MATTGKIRSNAIGVYISNTVLPDAGLTYSGPTFGDGATEDDEFELIACATSGSFSGSMEVIDATTKDNDGQREILTSALSWSMSCDGLIDYSTAAGSKSATELFDLWKAKTKVRIAWTTGVDGDVMLWGDAYITSYEETAGLNEVATYAVQFEGDGTITKSTIDDTNVAFTNNND
ncbi:MAG: phage tail tube protein [Candidatus Limnocylindrus sp.]